MFTSTKENDMKALNFFHGCNNPAPVLKAIAAARGGEKALHGHFHIAEKRGVAHNYGKYIIAMVLAGHVEGAHVGKINKLGNFNAQVGEEMEIVMKDDAAKFDFAEKVIAINVHCPDGRVAQINIENGEIEHVA
jgi:hypothetical protein